MTSEPKLHIRVYLYETAQWTQLTGLNIHIEVLEVFDFFY